MLKVLLADDKSIIRRGVKAIIESSGTGFGTILECSNGREALELIRKEDIDLVITDIRMPEIDGIKLMESVHSEKLPPKFIVLSGYDDFQYARESIIYGAKAYLLKPLDRQELIAILKKLEKEILSERDANSAAIKAVTMEKQFREDELRLMLLIGSEGEEAKKKLSGIQFPFVDSSFCLALLYSEEIEKVKGDILVNDSLEEKFAGYIENQAVRYILLEVGKTNLLIAESKEIIYNILSLFSKEGTDCFAGVSEEFEDCARLREAYLQAVETLKYRYVFPERRILFYSDISKLPFSLDIPAADIHKIGQIIGTDKITAIDDLIARIFDKNTISGKKINYLEAVVNELYSTLSRIVDILPYKWTNELVKFTCLGSIYNSGSIREYLSVLKEYMNLLNSYVLSMKSVYNCRTEVDKAIDYIEKNYNTKITLTTISNHVSLNYSYFSHAFSERTGMSFIDYLRKTRINKAKELLSNSSVRIYEIADRIGFENYKHFSRAFREVVGVSPAEYREMSLLGDKGSDNSNEV